MKEQNEKKESEVILEVSLRLRMKDYKFRLGTKRAWLIAILLLLVRGISYLLKGGP